MRLADLDAHIAALAWCVTRLDGVDMRINALPPSDGRTAAVTAIACAKQALCTEWERLDDELDLLRRETRAKSWMQRTGPFVRSA